MNDHSLSNFDPFAPQTPEPAPKKKNSHPLLTAFSVLGILIILALAAYIYYLLFLAPNRSPIMGNQAEQVNLQETALQAAAEATAVEMYLNPSQVPPSQAEPTQPHSGQAQPQTRAQVSGIQAESAALAEPAENSGQEKVGSASTQSNISAQVGLLGLLGLATILLLAIIIVRRLRASKK